MTLLAFKQKLYQTLESYYPSTELASFFQILLEDVLQLSKIDFALKPDLEIPQKKATQLHQIIIGLSKQEPIQYLIGFSEFMGLKFSVNRDVLIPRPETAALVQWILKETSNTSGIEILDIGTGSGCIPITLAKNLPKTKVTSMDVSQKALQTATQNAINNHVEVTFIEQNILTTTKLPSVYDVMVSNPPYVRNLEKVEMQKNVLDYEPHLALFVSDKDPLLFYRKIAQLALKHLKPNGALYFEINQYLGKETVDLLKEFGYQNIELQKDLFGNNRMIKAKINK